MKNLQTKHYLFIALLLISTIAVYLFVPVGTQMDVSKPSDMGERPMAEKQPDAISIENFKAEMLSKFSPELKTKITSLESELQGKSETDTALNQLYSKLAAAYADGGAPEVAAWYVSKKAGLANTAIAWERAGDNFIALISDPQTAQIIKPTLLQQTILCYEKASTLDPANADLKVKLGEGYMEGSEDVMKGVKLMLDVVRADSNHYMANLMLGKYGIKSGQYEKAIARLEKVISLHSKKLDGYFLLVDAYAASGNNEKAAETLIKAKKLIKDKNLLKEIDIAIEELKQKK